MSGALYNATVKAAMAWWGDFYRDYLDADVTYGPKIRVAGVPAPSSYLPRQHDGRALSTLCTRYRG